MKQAKPILQALTALVLAAVAAQANASEVKHSNYKGWRTLELNNGFAELHLAPDLGGRIIQYKIKDFEFLWVNPSLAGRTPPPEGVGPRGEWLNWGGDKLWPAPQGWSGPDQWPGPPGPALEGTPHTSAVLKLTPFAAAIAHTSPKDPYTGIQFYRQIILPSSSTRVLLESRMTNVDTKPRRWGIWQVTQLNCDAREGKGFNRDVWAWCPMNPKSIFPGGFRVLYGAYDNPAWRPDKERNMMRVNYRREVGKIALDSMAGWLAVAMGKNGYVFVERFQTFPDKKYPDDATVEFWLQGPGTIKVAGKEAVIRDTPEDAPPYMEAEVLSPFAELKPNEMYVFINEWFATNTGGSYPILNCTKAGVMCEEMKARVKGNTLTLTGRFGVFYHGRAGLAFYDDEHNLKAPAEAKLPVSPLQPLVLSDATLLTSGTEVPEAATRVALFVNDALGVTQGELAEVPLEREGGQPEKK